MNERDYMDYIDSQFTQDEQCERDAYEYEQYEHHFGTPADNQQTAE